KEDENELWNNHVELGLWADFMVVAPATANTMAKMSTGVCDNLLLATYLSAKCPVYFAPAMDLDMYKHPSTVESLKKLQEFGDHMIPVASGELASGLVGEGRMAEPEDIIAFIEKEVVSKLPLKGKRVLITAGPTYEAIDPVRFIGNHSSGKMGFAIAKTAAQLGAEVFLIAGPSAEKIVHSFVKRINVVSAEEMYKASHEYFSTCDIAILSAAVADYKPKNIAQEKIKKKDTSLDILLEPTKDILASLGAIKKNQFLVGFALETNNELENAISKLKRKNLDAIVLNSLQDKGAGFATDTNKVTFIDKSEFQVPFELKSKTEVADDILNEILKRINA
ncbi:MAG: bifunctional phosphopantothenoylcysteine decarboxylase/phosphopantothenate--cysteine ligase CoaBC, partial [Flavobacteriaceae bacterium]|nr:bifunctional phosphopantothenoylcysteine decarboxylase/phosphopantothenate--cysteine ligase CoaBC [Flavobacteriaceae bacterium]